MKIGDHVIYDRFGNGKCLMRGIVTSPIITDYNITVYWVDCDGERFLCPISRLKLNRVIL